MDYSDDLAASITCPALDRTFPALEAFYDVHVSQASELFGQAPFFDRDALKVGGIVERYAMDDLFPGGDPLLATFSPFWLPGFACRSSNLYFVLRTGGGVLDEFFKVAMDGFNHLRTYTFIHEGCSGSFVYRTHGEFKHLESLNAIPAIRIG